MVLASCGNENRVQPQLYDSRLDKGTVTIYGQYYEREGLELNVLELDLYSPTITFSDTTGVGGYGTNVYMSDVFVTNSQAMLEDGVYAIDSVPEIKTILRGVSYNSDVHNLYSGAYVLDLKSNGSFDVVLVRGGDMVVKNKGDSTIIDFTLILDDKDETVYKTQYRGKLTYYDGRPSERIQHISASGKIAVR